MLPVLFKYGSLTIYAWGFTLSLAILLGTLLAVRLAGRIEMNSEQILDLAIVLVVGGVVGARLFYVFVYEPERYLREPLQIFAIWKGGLVYYGALIGGFITGTWYVIRKKLPFWSLADLVSPSLALGYGIVRLGCFMNGCCYGKETGSFVGVIFQYIEGMPCTDLVPRYPTQLFSSVIGFLLFGILIFIWYNKKFDGQVFLLFLILYGISRSIIESFRENLIVFGNITVSQIVSAIIVLIALIFYRLRSRQKI
ncbi:prolipoprotein diacylglyceryl transferase [Phosphitispora sp. TUW77]|uniref:prolipoprotein diacylglyceryl transferase n=1 Tax=Phosphitispora sp. TUW77 TaxID=3152361 RepID=UPI003AB23332